MLKNSRKLERFENSKYQKLKKLCVTYDEENQILVAPVSTKRRY